MKKSKQKNKPVQRIIMFDTSSQFLTKIHLGCGHYRMVDPKRVRENAKSMLCHQCLAKEKEVA